MFRFQFYKLLPNGSRTGEILCRKIDRTQYEQYWSLVRELFIETPKYLYRSARFTGMP
jgi:hypothetical protein